MDKSLGHRAVADDVERRTGVTTGWKQGRPEDDELEARLAQLLSRPLSAEEAVALSLLNNGRLQSTYEELGVSQADLVQAGLLKNPVFGLSVGLPISRTGLFEAEASLVQNFLDLFMLPLRKKIARGQFDAAVLRVTHDALEEVARVRTLFAFYVTAEQRLTLQRKVTAGFEATALLAQRQRDAGNITAYSLATERAALLQARMTTVRAELDALSLREELNQHLGLWGSRTQWRAITELPAPGAALPDAAVLEKLAVSKRVDLELARRQVELASQALSLAKTWRWVGSFELGIHGHQDPNGPQLIGPTLQLELPLFDQRQALIYRLSAEEAQSEHRLKALAIEVRSQVRLAYRKLVTAQQLVTFAETELVPSRREAVEQGQLLYNGMLIGLYELMAAKQTQVESEQSALEARRDFWAARAELVRALGGEWQEAAVHTGEPQ